MTSALVEDLPRETADLLHRRTRRAGAATVADHVRHVLCPRGAAARSARDLD
ncbi:MAG: hypothetical protein J0I34_29470 [Pseudonocardia sp.]|uniref:hypothetical protein n=1 Tax=Pseudonocardia sp. SCN 73-27 TaxID=1660132 RepID=UPI001AC38EA1|nr:hypothetical protein [Pseudonocardia sp. SCN 73-27]MBN9112903.1 hypothetical protein [Pseudonocardia sp.]